MELVAFCKLSDTSKDSDKLSCSLMGRLKDKMMPAKSRSTKLTQNRNAQKLTRNIEIGCLDLDKKTLEWKQVRTPMGGGKLVLSVSKDTTLQELKKRALKHFFPDGKNRKSKLREFEFQKDLRDYNENALESTMTVASVYEGSGRGMVRLYICSTKKMLGMQPICDEEQPIKVRVDKMSVVGLFD